MSYNATVTDKLLTMVKKFEGCSLEAYHDVNGYAIGYGNHYYEDGKTAVAAGDRITQERANTILSSALLRTCKAMAKIITNQSVTQNQFDALVSLRYNVGGQFNSGSTVVRMVNRNPNDPAIEKEYMKWCHSNHKVVAGLVKRRATEFAYYKTNKLDLNFTYVTQIIARDSISDMEEQQTRELRYVNTNYCSSVMCDDNSVAGAGGGSGDYSGDYSGDGSVDGDAASKTGATNTNQTDSQAISILLKAIDKGFTLGDWKVESKEDKYVFTTSINGNGKKVGCVTISIDDYAYYKCRVTSQTKPEQLDKLRNMNNNGSTDATEQNVFDNIYIKREHVDGYMTKFEKIIFQTDNGGNIEKSIFHCLYNDNKKSYKHVNKDDLYVGIRNAGKNKWCDDGVVKTIKDKMIIYFGNLDKHPVASYQDTKTYFGGGKNIVGIVFKNQHVIMYKVDTRHDKPNMPSKLNVRGRLKTYKRGN